jgi:hypothetical protein
MYKIVIHITVSCPLEYKEYRRDDVIICLRYSDKRKSYYDAKSMCNTEGGDLMKADSANKFNILKDFIST